MKWSQFLTGRRKSLFILSVSLAGFVILALLMPYGRQYSWLGLVLFLTLVAILRLLSQFEQRSG